MWRVSLRFIILAVTAVLAYGWPDSRRELNLVAPKLKSRDGVGIGSSAAASDLYGLGVHAGFYVQGLGILINLPRNLEDSGAGLKLACGSISLSILVSRIILAAQANISSAKAFLVLSLVLSLACKTVICEMVWTQDQCADEFIKVKLRKERTPALPSLK